MSITYQIGIIPEHQVVTAPNLTNWKNHYRSQPSVYHVIDGVTVGMLTPLFDQQTRTDIVFSCGVSLAGGIYTSYGPGCYWPTQYNSMNQFVFSNKVTTK